MAEATVAKQMLAVLPHKDNDFLLPRHLFSLRQNMNQQITTVSLKKKTKNKLLGENMRLALV